MLGYLSLIFRTHLTGTSEMVCKLYNQLYLACNVHTLLCNYFLSFHVRYVALSKPRVLYGGHNSYPLIPLADGR